MLTKNIDFIDFKVKSKKIKIVRDLSLLLKQNIEIINSLKPNYKYRYKKKLISRLKKFSKIRIIGIGGSILGAEAIYSFLKNKINKKFIFINNLQSSNRINKIDKKKILNIIISKSGNTLETIANANIFIDKNQKNIFLTEKKNNYIKNLAEKLKDEIIEHNNFIGGRYSVLSEVGMLPAEIMGLNEKKFKQLNNLIKNKNFINSLTTNISQIISLRKNKKFNSIILNYDTNSENLFKWYQQLVAESLGKKSKGILPFISSMPKDNHSLMQLYLDGPKNSFYTFFYALEKNSNKIDNKKLFSSHNYLKNKTLDTIIYSQKLATEKIFRKKKIPFRSFEILNRNEEAIGELFSFFILETILLGRALKVNPFDQPSVELIKKETKNFLIKI